MISKSLIKPRYRRGGTLAIQKSKYCYGGNGIWSTIGRTVFGDTAKKVINNVTKEKIAQTAGDALLGGASSSLKKATERQLDKLINKEKFKVTQNLIDRLPPITTGQGIVFD